MKYAMQSIEVSAAAAFARVDLESRLCCMFA